MKVQNCILALAHQDSILEFQVSAQNIRESATLFQCGLVLAGMARDGGDVTLGYLGSTLRNHL